MTIPVNPGKPVVTGSPVVGQVLTTTFACWLNGPTSYTISWLRGGTLIAGSSGPNPTYTPVAADVGFTLQSQIVARDADGDSDPVASRPTAVVTSGGTLPIAGANLTSSVSVAAQSSYVTASISPTSNNLVLVAVVSYLSTGAIAPTITGAGGTWVQVATSVSADTHRRVTVFRDLSSTPGSGALTIDFAGQVQANCEWTVDQFSNVDLSGTNGSGAIVQSVVGGFDLALQSAFSLTLAALSSVNNVGYGVMRRNQSTGITKGAAFTELSNVLATGVELEAEWKINNPTPDWTFSNVTATGVAIAIEIKHS